ncbi:hypothetical protein LCGC14_2187500 [marine sediment metagenome]|uniref:CMP-N-acetylneuraminic acid synthetase n=1 Tax=marine sediment metagenome TaxID=412755 RepID=A0A0F9FXX5_9ZZZZ
MENKILCIIPARSGSKGILNKNIIDLCGKPLISYVIESAISSKIFDKIVVSTNSEKISDVSKKYGAEVPFLRPEHLSTDESLVKDAITYTLENIKEDYEYVCVLQPSSPLLLSEDIKGAYFLLKEKKAEMVVSVYESPVNINWVGSISDDLSMKNFFSKDICHTRRQDFSKCFCLNGAIYFGEQKIFYYKEDYYKQDAYAYIMSRERSIDIDSYGDLKMAEYFLKKRRENE